MLKELAITVTFLGLLAENLSAQIIPDRTLENPSIVIHQGNNWIINGGVRQGNNLFHSLNKFSIPLENTATFNNALSIGNIITRVTGNQASYLEGTLQAQGQANLFLLNPNGIIFGSNASLDLGGSFLATTAPTLLFTDGTELEARTTKPLLTVSTPIGLLMNQSSGEIIVRGNGHELVGGISAPVFNFSTDEVISLKPNQSLALVAPEISIDGGILTAPLGEVTLSAVAEGVVTWQPGIRLGDYSSVNNFGDIELTSRAWLSGSLVQLQGHTIRLEEGSVVFLQNFSNFPDESITLTATNEIDLSGTDPVARIPGGIRSETLSEGKGADIQITTPNLTIREGGALQTVTYSAAPAGNIDLDVKESLALIGTSPRNPRVLSSITSTSFSAGMTGNISIETGQLHLQDGALIFSITAGTGQGGEVKVIGAEEVSLTGIEPITLTPSAISAATIGLGQAGNVTINTQRLQLDSGSRIDSSTFGAGDAGSVSIFASDSITLSGTVPNAINPTLIISAANLLNEETRASFGLPDLPQLTGESGSVNLQTSKLTVTGGAMISTRNDGSGNAGILGIEAEQIRVENGGQITAATITGSGGNINLSTQSLLLQRGNLTATAGGGGNGGNITINTDTLVALDSSSIAANAFQGSGGNVQIDTQAIFLSPDSDITASSELGIDGTIKIDAQTQFQNEVVPNAVNFLSSEDVIANSCLEKPNPQQSQFFITGTGGVPPNPYSGIYDWQIPESNSSGSQLGEPLVEAQRIVTTADGRRRLDVYPSAETEQSGSC